MEPNMKSAIKCQCCVSYSYIMLSINGIVPLPGMSYNTDYQIQKMHSNHVLAVLTRCRNGHSRTTYEHHTKCIYCNKRVTQIPHCRNSSKIQWEKSQKEAKLLYLARKYTTTYVDGLVQALQYKVVGLN